MITAGVDEAGCGPLAGPVYAAAVILAPTRPIAGLGDSKTLTAPRRAALYDEILAHAVAWGVGIASVAEIDELNILRARLLAMQRAIAALSRRPGQILVDGKFCPEFAGRAVAIVKGDVWVPAISAASIVAKVLRDRAMLELDAELPQYGFAEHKGYGTAGHLAALDRHGPSSAHRRSFRPVRERLAAVLS
ncbi:MAG: ribonuclease HII [Gammaproteobacteria bacterium]|nr:ribonuclease HII [Gammaproteobacteria bacterium]MBI5617288.1 ribonuclease HII [Gammaproteobacteria bacterium]